jgi:hypothetical protein
MKKERTIAILLIVVSLASLGGLLYPQNPQVRPKLLTVAQTSFGHTVQPEPVWSVVRTFTATWSYGAAMDQVTLCDSAEVVCDIEVVTVPAATVTSTEFVETPVTTMPASTVPARTYMYTYTFGSVESLAIESDFGIAFLLVALALFFAGLGLLVKTRTSKAVKVQ